MLIRNAVPKDLPQIMKIYENARSYMRKTGNPTQWSGGYPGEDVIRRDMEEGNFYVCENEDRIVGVFTFFMGGDPNYVRLDQGSWHSDAPYGTIHRVASDGSIRGFASICFLFCLEKCSYLRIDTHRDNRPMQKALHKFGFRQCGIVYMEDGTERIAFDFIRETERSH